LRGTVCAALPGRCCRHPALVRQNRSPKELAASSAQKRFITQVTKHERLVIAWHGYLGHKHRHFNRTLCSETQRSLFVYI
jgi:hypothetical protein